MTKVLNLPFGAEHSTHLETYVGFRDNNAYEAFKKITAYGRLEEISNLKTDLY